MILFGHGRTQAEAIWRVPFLFLRPPFSSPVLQPRNMPSSLPSGWGQLELDFYRPCNDSRRRSGEIGILTTVPPKRKTITYPRPDHVITDTLADWVGLSPFIDFTFTTGPLSYDHSAKWNIVLKTLGVIVIDLRLTRSWRSRRETRSRVSEGDPMLYQTLGDLGSANISGTNVFEHPLITK